MKEKNRTGGVLQLAPQRLPGGTKRFGLHFDSYHGTLRWSSAQSRLSVRNSRSALPPRETCYENRREERHERENLTFSQVPG